MQRKSLETWELLSGILWLWPSLLNLFTLTYAFQAHPGRSGQVQGIGITLLSFTTRQKFCPPLTSTFDRVYTNPEITQLISTLSGKRIPTVLGQGVKGPSSLLRVRQYGMGGFWHFLSICNFPRPEILSVWRSNKSKPLLKIFLIISNFGSRAR